MTPTFDEQYVHNTAFEQTKNRKFPHSVISAFDYSLNWLRFRVLNLVPHPQWMRRCVVANLMVEGQLLSLDNAQRLLADMRCRQLECARQGKIKQSADYALKAQRLRKAIDHRLQQTS